LSGDERERREKERERETWRSRFWLMAKIMQNQYAQEIETPATVMVVTSCLRIQLLIFIDKQAS
jgi:hypothetical protein